MAVTVGQSVQGVDGLRRKRVLLVLGEIEHRVLVHQPIHDTKNPDKGQGHDDGVRAVTSLAPR